MSRPKMHVKKGDTVIVLTGHKDDGSHDSGVIRGTRGQVLVAYPREGKVIVSGVNVIKRHTRPSTAHPQGGIIEREAPIYASKVQVVCPECGKPTRVAHSFVSNPKAAGQTMKIRVCKKCGKSLDK